MEEKDARMEGVAFSIAKVIAGSSILGLVFWLSPIPLVELLSFFLFWLLPVLLIASALGLISSGTLAAIWGGTFSKRIGHWRERLKDNPNCKGPVQANHAFEG